MDLRSIINTDGGDGSKQAAPVTPVQAHPQQGFRDFSHPPHASPGKHPSQDYGAPPSAGGSISYASPTQQYQQNYQGRPPQPPPIQAPPQNDLRSPHRSFSVQSPYQHTPSSSNSQYPFPQHQTPQSPAQHQQYPPQHQQRDSYSQPNPPTHLQHQNSFPQPSPTPQTPPIGIPGAPHPYLQHQRSVSSVSTPTPTSANSQQPQYFNNQYSQDSPVSAGPYPTSQIPQHHRQASQQSQPGTPLGPPLTQRQSSGAFPQPSSPYQQRGSTGPFSQFPQTSPKPPAPPSIQRLSNTPSAYDSQRTSLSEQQRRSHSERERSVSVSPKTRLPSQPRGEIATPQSEREYNNSAKRKMDDREMSVEEPRVEPMDTQMHGNGSHRIPSTSPQQPAKKRIRYTEPPIWAQSIRNKGVFGANRGTPKVNGKQPLAVQPVHARPMETNGHQQAAARPAPVDGKAHPSEILGPWEPSITGIKPVEQVTKLVADFLFTNVVSRGDLGELASRGVDIEIEAKLGHIIDKETNERLRLPVRSECILMDNARVGFKSSMTESQHRALNDFLNTKLHDAHPQNPTSAARKRVEIRYEHLREADSFYELPQSMHGIIPPALREKLNPRHGVKVRVTHNQKTGEPKAKIIKARIVDLDIFNPLAPLDCRISINFEMRFDGDVEELGKKTGPDRNKDRLSYTQSMYQIDLTQVTQQLEQANGQVHTTKEHELEIELSTAKVRDQGGKAANGETNEYLLLVEGFIDNMRVLSRATPSQ